LLILQKSIKPLQLVLNEFFKKLDNGVLVTKSAFTQARRHLKATAFLGVLKERLKIDNFTGKTVASEAIKQDLFATLFLTCLESILTQTADLYLFKKSSLNKLRQTVSNHYLLISLKILW